MRAGFASVALILPSVRTTNSTRESVRECLSCSGRSEDLERLLGCISPELRALHGAWRGQTKLAFIG
jgi:hypothetical protein